MILSSLTSLQCWIILLSVILCEVCGSVCLKLSDSYNRITPSILVFLFYATSFGFFPFALQRIDLGTAYAVWSGVGTALTCIIGIVVFKESMATTKIAGVCIVLVGVALLNLSDDGGGGGDGEKYQSVGDVQTIWNKSQDENDQDKFHDNADGPKDDYGTMQKFELSGP